MAEMRLPARAVGAETRRVSDADCAESAASAPPPLAAEQVEAFVRDGFVLLERAFPREVADECRAFLWSETGCDPADPATWTRPVIRLPGYGGELFDRAARTPRLHGAFDQLVGPGRWLPREGLGTFPIRFPHSDPPGDDGWHIDGSFTPPGEQGFWVDRRSRGRALLMLFLFSDIGVDDAPTRIKAGSHLDVARFLEAAGKAGKAAGGGAGDGGAELFALCRELDAAGLLDSPDRRTVLATGRAGDVYLCHPFLIHAAQPHRGSTARFIAQPPLMPADPAGPIRLDHPEGELSPLERAVGIALG